MTKTFDDLKVGDTAWTYNLVGPKKINITKVVVAARTKTIVTVKPPNASQYNKGIKFGFHLEEVPQALSSTFLSLTDPVEERHESETA